MGVRAVPFFQHYDCVLHVVVGKMYPEVGAFKYIPLENPIWGSEYINKRCSQKKMPQVFQVIEVFEIWIYQIL